MTSLTEQQSSGIVFVKSPFVRGKASCPCQRIFVVYFPITDATEVKHNGLFLQSVIGPSKPSLLSIVPCLLMSLCFF